MAWATHRRGPRMDENTEFVKRYGAKAIGRRIGVAGAPDATGTYVPRSPAQPGGTPFTGGTLSAIVKASGAQVAI